MNNSPKQPKHWLPEIVYEETHSGEPSTFPFISVPENQKMPELLYIFEYKETGETEPGSKGEEIPIVDQIPHQFADLAVLKKKLKPEIYDEVRYSLGLMPLKEAVKLGKEKLDKVMVNVEKIKEELLAKKEKEEKS